MWVALRKALREMFVIGLGAGIVAFIFGNNVHTTDGALSCVVLGLIYSPALWAVYRLLRFMFFTKLKPTSI